MQGESEATPGPHQHELEGSRGAAFDGALQQMRVPDGTRLAYRRYGREGATRVVLCDGISCDGYIWRDLLPTLATHCDVLHLNYRGHGRSGLPRAPADCSMPDLAADMDYVLGSLGWSTDDEIAGPVFIGHSMGVQVALETAFRYPSRVGAMVLCCGSFGRVLDSFKHTDLGARLLPLFDAVTQTWRDSVSAAMRAFLPSPLSYTLAALTEIKSEHIRPKDFQPYLDHFARMPMDLFMGLLGDAAERTSMPFLPRVAQPTLVIAGQDDGFTPIASSKLLATTLPNAELLIVPHTSHTAPLEAPAIFEERITGFITTLAVPTLSVSPSAAVPALSVSPSAAVPTQTAPWLAWG